MDILEVPRSKLIKELNGKEYLQLVEAVERLKSNDRWVPPSILRRLAEYERVKSMAEFDRNFCSDGLTGVDEAGRGPLAGDVFAAAVILPPNVVIEGLNDSKKLSEKKREQLYETIVECAAAYAVARVDSEEIDRLNIRNATYHAMNLAVDRLDDQPKFVLIDGDAVTEMSLPHQCIIGGDGKSQAIAAASILAKVSRDRYMMEMDKQYPQYGFARHKGYGTAEHVEALRRYGPCPIHRETFLSKILG